MKQPKPPNVKWVRHPSARALVAAWIHRGATLAGQKNFDPREAEIMLSDGSNVSFKAFVKSLVLRDGLWGWTLTKGRVREIHYWAKPRISKVELAMMLGHEMGHNLGKKTTGWREEHRADQYGFAVAEAVKELLRAGWLKR